MGLRSYLRKEAPAKVLKKKGVDIYKRDGMKKEYNDSVMLRLVQKREAEVNVLYKETVKRRQKLESQAKQYIAHGDTEKARGLVPQIAVTRRKEDFYKNKLDLLDYAKMEAESRVYNDGEDGMMTDLIISQYVQDKAGKEELEALRGSNGNGALYDGVQSAMLSETKVSNMYENVKLPEISSDEIENILDELTHEVSEEKNSVEKRVDDVEKLLGSQ